jgi:Calcineurin-like phosphoesterase/Purple acid Phosphatase, N-terminal domain
MKTIFTALAVLFILLFSVESRANDTLFKLAQPLATAHNWSYKGGGTNLDGAANSGWKNSLTYAESGWLTNRPAPFRLGTTPPVANTTIPGDNTAGGGGIATARYPTLYFRKTVNIANPSSYINFKINAKFDDAIVVWVNGQEAFRNNISANPAYATLSTTSIAGDGATIFSGNVNTSLFNPGDNLIAVEIHQTTATSGDLFFDMELIGVNDVAVSRGPYLNMGGQTGITIRWRTDVATNSRVTYGTTLGTYTNTVDDAAVTTEHVVNLTGLNADTKYFYTVGSSSGVIESGAANYFVTVPPATANRKMRIAAFGDCGFVSANQTFTKQAYMSFLAARGISDIDALIMMGDNVYDVGTDAEWQTNFFDPYKDVFLKNWKMYPSPGNHDYGNTNSQAETNNRNNNYYQNFTLPTAGELGGVASGTEAFYSFDIGDIHFLSLDSYGRETASANSKMYDTLTAQAVWVKADLAANTKKWVVAFWHHAPYTKIGLNSDAAGELTNVRENFIRILERYGVDLVLCGHSHGYERSYLLKNYYKAAPSGAALLDADFRKNLHTADSSSALYDGTSALTCAYTYNSGKYNHGTVYAVSGSSGKNDQLALTGSGYPHDAMYFSQAQKGGAMYFEVDSNRLDVKYIWQNGNSTPLVGDSFTVFKDVKKFTTYTVAKNGVLNIQSSWKGAYNWFVGGTATNLSSARTFTVPTNTSGTYRYVVKDFSTNTCLKDSFEVVVSLTLPVALASFTANLQNNKVVLDWATSIEENNKYFTLEKSIDGINFSFLAKVDGAGNSSITKNYRAFDLAPVNGNNYYRLSQTNADGKTTYFEIKKVSYKSNLSFNAAIIYSSNGVSVNIHSIKNDHIKVSINDVLGRQLLKEAIPVSAGSNNKTYQLNSGVYFISLSNTSNEIITSKVIIK